MFTRKFVVKLRAERFCVEAEIRHFKEDLHTKIFLLLFNRKSGTVSSFTVRSRGHTVGTVSLERLDGFECKLASN